MVTDSLYYSVHPFTNSVSAPFSFDEDVIKAAVRRIYEKKFNPLTEIDEGIFNETWNIFNKATDEGFGVRGYSDPDYDFYQQIRYNNAVFAAFKTHRQQNDIAAQLLDDKGKLKTFSQFAADVEPITGKYNQQWLLTEYDTAVIRAHQAADWVQFGKVKDIFPNLRWMPTTSITPDAVHQQYWSIELTLPQDHPFWKKHRPGDRWNCKCSLEATDNEVTSEELIPDDGEAPDKGLDNNPGEDGMMFSFSHPYFAAGYWAYKKLAPIVTNFIERQLSERKTRAFFAAREKARETLREVYQNSRISAANLQTGLFYDSKKGLKALVNHSISANEIEAAMSVPRNIDKLKFVRVSPLGEGKDMTNPLDVAKVAEKRERGVVQYNTYKYKYRSKTYYIKLEESVHGQERLYAFTKKP